MIVRGFADETYRVEGHVASQISAERRAERLGQRGLAVCFAGVPQAGQTDVMYDLERRLFDMGHAACVIDVAALADGTRSPSLFADLALQCLRAGMIVLYSTGLPRASDRLRLREQLGPEQLLLVFADDAVPALASASAESLHCGLTVDERDRTISLLSKAIGARCELVSDG
jgi:adenylylsulfate kinase-like enzyme